MRPRRFDVSHSRNGFFLIIEEYSRFRSGVLYLAEKVCELLGHRFCSSPPLMKLFEWEWSAVKPIVEISIDREIADKISTREDAWSYLDEEKVEL